VVTTLGNRLYDNVNVTKSLGLELGAVNVHKLVSGGWHTVDYSKLKITA